MTKIIPPRGRILLLHEDTSNKHKFSNGKEIFIDNAFNHAQLVNQDAIVYSWARDISDLKEGDKVYCHHFIRETDKKIKHENETYIFLSDPQVFCIIRDGKIIMRRDYVLIEPALEPEENYKTSSGIYLKPNREEIKRWGYIKALNKEAKELGLEVGDKVHYLKGGEYRMEVEGKEYFKMANKHLLAKAYD